MKIKKALLLNHFPIFERLSSNTKYLAMYAKSLATTLFALFFTLSSPAKTPPEGVELVDRFDLERYLGLWYEVARTDNRFERDLESVTAEYTMIDDETVRVLNRGFNARKGKWSEVDGKAYKIGEPNEGQLKVTFFWPFYAGYNIFELDHEGYQYALVSGDHHGYLWILARTPTLPQKTIEKLLAKADSAGFDTSELIWVDHNSVHPSLAPKVGNALSLP